MSDAAIILAAITAAAIVYYVDDGRIRLAVVAVLGALMFWRKRPLTLWRKRPNKLEPEPDIAIHPTTINTGQVDTDAQNTDREIDSIPDARGTDADVRAGLELLDERDRLRRDAKRRAD
jgi:hypothetical protein